MRIVVAVVVATISLVGSGLVSHAAGPLAGDIPARGGVALAHWGGGTIEDVEQSAAAEGCDLISVWVTKDGGLIGNVVGAPASVNERWLAAVGTYIESGSILIVVCSDIPHLTCENGSSQIFEYTPDFGLGTPQEALSLGTAHLPLPPGTFEQVRASDSVVTWILVDVEQEPVGVFDAARTDAGWRLREANWCVS